LNLPKISEKEAAKAEEILVYINNLYTVYTNLVLYNRAGKVIAVSNPAESALVGKSLGESWVETALKIRNTQEYCVSDFVPSPLYQNKPTYIYNAAINAPDNPSLAVGGIGIVFDSEPEFEAMLMDALPRDTDGQLVNGAFAAFVDQRGMVISATRPDIMVGDRIDIDTTLLNANHDGSRSAIVELNGNYYAVGIRVSNGYREYKSEQDKYKNVVFALVFMELDKVRDVDSSDKGFPSAEVESDNSLHRTLTENYIEVATFYIDNHWYGVDVNEVVEAIKYENIQTIPCASAHIAGTYYYNGEVIVILDPSKVLGYSDKRDPSQQQIIVFNSPRGRFGLIVDYLGKIPRINKDLLEHKNALLDQAGSLIECIVKPDTSGDDTQPMLIILNTGEVYQSLSQGADVDLDEMQALTWAEAEA
jgi:chemotaxis signal transduction protein